MTPALRGMRNPMNSWDKADSYYDYEKGEFVIGPKDMDLAKRLYRGGTDHRKYLRMLVVYMDINAPLYWWKEFDTYRMGVEKNSCSTMHTLKNRDLTLEDFSYDKLDATALPMLLGAIQSINKNRQNYMASDAKAFWYNMIQLLPSSFNQKRTVMVSYEALLNMYNARKGHKLDEWQEFCHVVKTFPLIKDLIGD